MIIIIDMKRFKKILRIDIFNRLIVSLSMIIFSILPAYELYFVGINTPSELVASLSNIIFLVSLLGNGFFALYKPTRLPCFFFFDIMFLYLFYSDAFLSPEVIRKIPFDVHVLYVVFSFVAGFFLFINMSYLFYFLKKNKRYKTEFAEHTNSDSYYDFLNAKKNNKEVEEKIFMMYEKRRSIVDNVKRIKISKLLRFISYIVFALIFVFYLSYVFKTSTPDNKITYNLLFYPLVSSFIISTVLIIFSYFFPSDYKYAYYFNSILFNIVIIFSCFVNSASMFLSIFSLVVFIISLVVTMITEGRTWMGESYDE